MLKIPQIYKKAPMGIFERAHSCDSGVFWEPPADEIRYRFETDLYTVTVNGEPCPVHACRESAIPFNRTWPGKQRDVSQTEEAAFVTFRSDSAVTLCVKPKGIANDAWVRPLSKKVSVRKEEDTLVFTLTEVGGYVLELGSSRQVLHIFFNPLKSYPEAQSATYYFGPGIHFPGVITLRDNDSVYIDDEAIVFGSLNSLGAKNVHVYGGGILDNTYEERIVEHSYENYTKGTFRLYNCQNVCVEDVILLNSCNWVMALFYCRDVIVDNVKIVGQWRYNTDGIDVVNTSNVQIKNCFIRSFDDTITIKGIYDYSNAIENIAVDNCVLWCGWGYTCELGIETHAPTYRNIRFSDCDVIHAQGAALAIPNGHAAKVHDVRFENMRVEFQHDTLPAVYQQRDEMMYDGFGKSEEPWLIALINPRFVGIFKAEEGYAVASCEGGGEIYDVHFKNIRVYVDRGYMKPRVVIKSEDATVVFENITIDELYLNDERQRDLTRFDTEMINCKDVYLDGESIC